LIELLVVISIIGLLSTVVLASLNSARAKAKNAKIVSQAEELEKAVRVYGIDKGKEFIGLTGSFYCQIGPECQSNFGSMTGFPSPILNDYINGYLVENNNLPRAPYFEDYTLFYSSPYGDGNYHDLNYFGSSAGTCSGVKFKKHMFLLWKYGQGNEKLTLKTLDTDEVYDDAVYCWGE
jgi:type II secretory pathway pseudopilin PulG